MRFKYNFLGWLVLLCIMPQCSKVNSGAVAIEGASTAGEVSQVIALRELVAGYGHRGYSTDGSLAFQEQFSQWETMKVSALLADMDQTDYYISCGYLSRILRNLYREKGWKSTTYNFGFPDTRYTHEVTLVELPGGKVVLQDPTFNTTLVKGDSLVDFFHFIGNPNDEAFHFTGDTAFVKLILDQQFYERSSVACVPGFVGEEVTSVEEYEAVKLDFYANLQLNLYDTCHGFMTILHEELDAQVTYPELFLRRISEMDGAADWRIKVDSILDVSRRSN